jgi:hypothetical protein
MNYRALRLIALALCLTALFAIASRAAAQNQQRCFPETGQCIGGRIRYDNFFG